MAQTEGTPDARTRNHVFGVQSKQNADDAQKLRVNLDKELSDFFVFVEHILKPRGKICIVQVRAAMAVLWVSSAYVVCGNSFRFHVFEVMVFMGCL